ncbi:hypothetical protein [Commensalibacter communis]|uniref:hypothetical protein n=1 Tax=Commensalibacter communis TaxID=2972786 RepID=UPI00232D3A38|nr:hypothetical protein [Commensalibacter communis]
MTAIRKLKIRIQKKEERTISDFMTVAVSTRANERAVALGEAPKYNLFFFQIKK